MIFKPSTSSVKSDYMKPNDLSNFQFRFLSAGHYRVTYTTRRGDFWVSLVTDMTLIDNTNGADWAKGVDIERLRNHVKLNGAHYSKSGKRIV